jgi:hypothetical protein
VLVVTVLEAPECHLRDCRRTLVRVRTTEPLLSKVLGTSLRRGAPLSTISLIRNTLYSSPHLPTFPHAAQNNAMADLLWVISTVKKDRGQPINQNGIPILQVNLHLNDVPAVGSRGSVK